MNTAKSKTILVTGGTGMLGAYVLQSLVKQGFTNICATRRANSPTELIKNIEEKIQWLEGDLSDLFFVEDALEGINQIYHCAAIVSYDSRDHKIMKKTNIEITANIVNAALEASIDKLVHVSSVAALGRKKNNPNISEESKWEKSELNSQYGVSKQMSEMEVWRGQAEGLNVAIVNPGIIVGGGFWEKGSARFFHNIAKGFKFYSEGKSGFVDARDVADFMIKLMNSDIVGERYLLVSENITYKNFFFQIADSLQVKRPTIAVNAFIRALAWRVEWIRSRLTGARSLVSKETAENSSRVWIYDNSKSLNAFSNFKYRPLEKTVKETGDLFLKSKSKKGGLLRI